jgi:hypothetical protein
VTVGPGDLTASHLRLNKLDADTPLILEHLESDEDYALAAEHIRSVAGRIQVAVL